LQQRLVKTGGRLIKHARYYWLLLAESHLTRLLFAGMLRKIAALPSPAGYGKRRAEQISMTTLGRREKCLRNRSEKGPPRRCVARRRRNRPLPASLETQWTKTGLNLAGGGCLVYTASWNWSVKTEIPVEGRQSSTRMGKP
jgi:hypothetical protein